MLRDNLLAQVIVLSKLAKQTVTKPYMRTIYMVTGSLISGSLAKLAAAVEHLPKANVKNIGIAGLAWTFRLFHIAPGQVPRCVKANVTLHASR